MALLSTDSASRACAGHTAHIRCHLTSMKQHATCVNMYCRCSCMHHLLYSMASVSAFASEFVLLMAWLQTSVSAEWLCEVASMQCVFSKDMSPCGSSMSPDIVGFWKGTKGGKAGGSQWGQAKGKQERQRWPIFWPGERHSPHQEPHRQHSFPMGLQHHH